MKEERIFCDVCDKELNDKGLDPLLIPILLRKLLLKDFFYDEDSEVAVCRECLKSFDNWLKERTK